MARMFPPPQPAQGQRAARRYLRIGELAARSGCSVATIRFYERKGLLPPPEREDGNDYRAYDEGSLARLQALRHLQELGFTLREIATLRTASAGKTRHKDMRRIVEAKREEVVIEVERANRALVELDQMIATCSAHPERSAADCPISHLID
jgi:DNA-binding transcriptional MerR regulator